MLELKYLATISVISAGVLFITLNYTIDKFLDKRENVQRLEMLKEMLETKRYELKIRFQDHPSEKDEVVNSLKFSGEIDLFAKILSHKYNCDENLVRDYLLKDCVQLNTVSDYRKFFKI